MSHNVNFLRNIDSGHATFHVNKFLRISSESHSYNEKCRFEDQCGNLGIYYYWILCRNVYIRLVLPRSKGRGQMASVKYQVR